MAIEILQDLIRIPSYSGKERPILDYIQNHFCRSGLETFFQNRNLLLHLEGRDRSRAFIFNSHVDVVDAGDETRWIHRPWSGDIEGDRIYGRGATDMKSGVYASMETAEVLAKRHELPCDVWFTYVVEEETDGAGTKEFAEWFKTQGFLTRYRQTASLFTEGTSLTGAEYGHRGSYFIQAAIDGDAAHSSNPQAIKIHAIMRMVDFIGDLRIETNNWHDQFQGSDFAPPTITPTAISAHSASPNKTADHCVAAFDLRTIPNFHQEAFERVRELATKRGINLSLICPDSPTGYTSPKDRIIKVIKEVIPQIKLSVSQGAADLGFLTAIGIPGIVFGPGDKSEQHIINESASVEKTLAASSIFEKIYYQWAD